MTVAVTGSASGLGAAICSRLAGAGTNVIGVDLDRADVEADLSIPDGRADAVARVTELAGGALTGVVACAGVGPQVRPGGRIVAVNFFGAVSFLDGLFAALAAGNGNDRPAAVAICSNSATVTPIDAPLLEALVAGDEAEAQRRADTVQGATAYGMSKLALGRAVRRRVGPWGERGVRLNAVAPGPIDTPLLQGGLDDPELGPLIEGFPIPLGHRAAADDVAAVVTFLLSPAAGNIHGSIVFCDGGTDALLRPDVF